MMYRVLEYFTDLQDNDHEYKVGDTYPRKGYEPTEERIEQLTGDSNVRGRAIIEAVETSAEETSEESSEEEKPKKKRSKKAE